MISGPTLVSFARLPRGHLRPRQRSGTSRAARMQDNSKSGAFAGCARPRPRPMRTRCSSWPSRAHGKSSGKAHRKSPPLAQGSSRPGPARHGRKRPGGWRGCFRHSAHRVGHANVVTACAGDGRAVPLGQARHPPAGSRLACLPGVRGGDSDAGRAGSGARLARDAVRARVCPQPALGLYLPRAPATWVYAGHRCNSRHRHGSTARFCSASHSSSGTICSR